MIPNGVEVGINTERPVELLELAVRSLFVQWKNAVVCDANGEGRWQAHTFYNIPFAEHVELFVFPSKNHLALSFSTDQQDHIQLVRTENALKVGMPKESREGMELVDALTAASMESK